MFNKRYSLIKYFSLIFLTLIFVQSLSNSAIIKVQGDTNNTIQITNLFRSHDNILAGIEFSVYCQVETNGSNIVKEVLLRYTIDGENHTTRMYSNFYSYYVGVVPGQEINSSITYWVEAKDSENNTAKSIIVGPLTVFDGNLPLIGDIIKNPVVPTNLDTINITTWVTDNVGVKDVKIEYWINNQVTSNIILMNNDGGAKYVGSLPTCEIGTKIVYRIVAVDTSPLQNTKYSENRTVYITDGVHPYIVFYESDPNEPNASQEFYLIAEAWDSTGIDKVNVEVTYSYNSISIIYEMENIPDTNLYQKKIVGQPENTNITFFFTAIDSSSEHLNSSTPTYSIVIHDNIKPIITNVVHEIPTYLPNYYIEINATITDVSEIGRATIFYTYDNGENITLRGSNMVRYANTSVFHAGIETQTAGTVCTYWIDVEDIHQNRQVTENYSLTFIDGIPPKIDNVNISPINSTTILDNTTVQVNCSVTDENNVTVKLEVKIVDYYGFEIETKTFDMLEKEENIFEYNITATNATNIVYWTIIATDDSLTNNTACYSSHYVVVDQFLPQILLCDTEPNDNSDTQNIYLKLVDDGKIKNIRVRPGISDGLFTTWYNPTYYAPELSDSYWEGTITTHLNLYGLTNYYFKIEVTVYDVWDNSFTDTYIFLIEDKTPPQINIVDYPETLNENEDFNITLQIVDNSSYTAWLLYQVNYGEEYIAPIIDTNGNLTGTISSSSYDFSQILLIYICAEDEKGNKIQIENPLTYVITDGNPPYISNDTTLFSYDNVKIAYNSTLTVRAIVNDPSGIDYVKLHYRYADGNEGEIDMNIDFYNQYNYSVEFNIDTLNYRNTNVELWIIARDNSGWVVNSYESRVLVLFRDIFSPSGKILDSLEYIELKNKNNSVTAQFKDDTSININSIKMEVKYFSLSLQNISLSRVISSTGENDYITEFEIDPNLLVPYVDQNISLRVIVEDSQSNIFFSQPLILLVKDTTSPCIDADSWIYSPLNPNVENKVYLPSVFDVSGINDTFTLVYLNSSESETEQLNTLYDSNLSRWYVLVPSFRALTLITLNATFSDIHGNINGVLLTETITDLEAPVIYSLITSPEPSDNKPIEFSANISDDGEIYLVELIVEQNGINISYFMSYNSSLYVTDINLDKGSYNLWIKAVDMCNKVSYYSSTLIVIDKTPPSLISVNSYPDGLLPIDKNDFYFIVEGSDNEGLSQIIVEYTINSTFYRQIQSVTDNSAIFMINDTEMLPYDTILITNINILDNAVSPNCLIETTNLPQWIVGDNTPPEIYSHTDHNFDGSSTSDFYLTVYITENDVRNHTNIDSTIYYKYYNDSSWMNQSLYYGGEVIEEQCYYEVILSPPWKAGTYEYYITVSLNGMTTLYYNETTPLTFAIEDFTSPIIKSGSLVHTSQDELQPINSNSDEDINDFVISFIVIEHETEIDLTIGDTNTGINVLLSLDSGSSWTKYGEVTNAQFLGNGEYQITYAISADDLKTFIHHETILYKIKLKDSANNEKTYTSFEGDTFSFDIKDLYPPQIQWVLITKESNPSSNYWDYDLENLPEGYYLVDPTSTLNYSITGISPLLDEGDFGYSDIIKIGLKIKDHTAFNNTPDIRTYFNYDTENINIESNISSANSEFLFWVEFDLANIVGSNNFKSHKDTTETPFRLQLNYYFILTDSYSNELTSQNYSIYLYDTYAPKLTNGYNRPYFTDLNDNVREDEGKCVLPNEYNKLMFSFEEVSLVTQNDITIQFYDTKGEIFYYEVNNNEINLDNNGFQYSVSITMDYNTFLSFPDVRFCIKIVISPNDGLILEKYYLLDIEASNVYYVKMVANYNEINWAVDGGTAIAHAETGEIYPGQPLNEVTITLGNLMYETNIEVYAHYEMTDKFNPTTSDIVSVSQLLKSFIQTPSSDLKLTKIINSWDANPEYAGNIYLFLKLYYTWDIPSNAISSSDITEGKCYIYIHHNKAVEEVDFASSPVSHEEITDEDYNSGSFQVKLTLKSYWTFLPTLLEYSTTLTFVDITDSSNTYDFNIICTMSADTVLQSNLEYTNLYYLSLTCIFEVQLSTIIDNLKPGIYSLKLLAGNILTEKVEIDTNNDETVDKTFPQNIVCSIQVTYSDNNPPSLREDPEFGLTQTYEYDEQDIKSASFKILAADGYLGLQTPRFYWRKIGSTNWNEATLTYSNDFGNEKRYYAILYDQDLGTEGIEYFFTIEDESWKTVFGRIEDNNWNPGMKYGFKNTPDEPSISDNDIKPLLAFPILPNDHNLKLSYVGCSPSSNKLSSNDGVTITLQFDNLIGDFAESALFITSDDSKKFETDNTLYIRIKYWDHDSYVYLRSETSDIINYNYINKHSLQLTVRLHDNIWNSISDTAKEFKYYINSHYHFKFDEFDFNYDYETEKGTSSQYGNWQKITVVDDVAPKITDVFIYDSNNEHSIDETYKICASAENSNTGWHVYEASSFELQVYMNKEGTIKTIDLVGNDYSAYYAVYEIKFSDYYSDLSSGDTIYLQIIAWHSNNDNMKGFSATTSISFTDTHQTSLISSYSVNPYDSNDKKDLRYYSHTISLSSTINSNHQFIVTLEDLDTDNTALSCTIDVTFIPYTVTNSYYYKYTYGVSASSIDTSTAHRAVFTFDITPSMRVMNHNPVATGSGRWAGNIKITIDYGKNLENTKVCGKNIIYEDYNSPYFYSSSLDLSSGNMGSQVRFTLKYRKWSPPKYMTTLTNHLVKMQYKYGSTWVDLTCTRMEVHSGGSTGRSYWYIYFDMDVKYSYAPDRTMYYRYKIVSQDQSSTYYSSSKYFTWKDVTNPTISTVSFAGDGDPMVSQRINTRVKDNYYVSNVYIQYYWSGHGSSSSPYSTTASKYSGSRTDGWWKAFIPGTTPNKNVYVYYRVKAKDSSGRTTYSSWKSYHSYSSGPIFGLLLSHAVNQQEERTYSNETNSVEKMLPIYSSYIYDHNGIILTLGTGGIMANGQLGLYLHNKQFEKYLPIHNSNNYFTLNVFLPEINTNTT
ncbi:MAG: hypothetical protein ACTSRR_06730 [Candidatus Heimdallarchaeaceae archaeon]